MNQSLLKSFAPDARTRFRTAMEQRAALLGLSADKEPVPAQKSGDKIYIGGKAFPVQWEEQRKKLAARIARQGWNAVMEEAAYTWFNRFAALRYMEVHGYTPQGVRVLTPVPQGSQPEILERAASINLPGLKKEEILELKLDGQRDEELYRLLVLALCESFHGQLPLLFPAVQEDLELLLPDMLLRSDSLLSWFVQGLGEEEWQEIEVLGWLYQYYISELKDAYMAQKSAYKKEEIPAVTQLFTPKWIVQYLVHNSLGRTWLLHYPESGLKAKMPYYIEPAPQEPEVEIELKRLFGGSLNPEEIKLLDPAMGSGHILVTAYEVLREIYLERGYQRQQCARLILEKNLYGLDIDLRASEIACFALIMKAREDDPSILATGKGLRLNLLSFRDCAPEDRADLLQNLNPDKDQREALQTVLSLFEQGTLFGSLIQVPENLVGKLTEITAWLENVVVGQDLLASKAAESVLMFVRLAQALGQKYDQVVSNPPYMGTKWMNAKLRSFVETRYLEGKSDLFASFMLKGFASLRGNGILSMITMQNWMFLSSYEALRLKMIDNHSLSSMIHLGARAFSQISGEVVQTTAFAFINAGLSGLNSSCIRAINGNEDEKRTQILNGSLVVNHIKTSAFKAIPGYTFAYWISSKVRNCFIHPIKLKDVLQPKQGTSTGDDVTYVRYWHEPIFTHIGFGVKSLQEALASKYQYFPLDKGGSFRKWYGNNEKIIRLDKNAYDQLLQIGNHLPSRDLYFLPGLTWSKIASGDLSVRFDDFGFVFSSVGLKGFPSRDKIDSVLSFMNSRVCVYFSSIISPTLSIISGDIEKLPFKVDDCIYVSAVRNISIGKSDWDAYETSWDFQSLPWLPNTLPTYLDGISIPAPDQHFIASCWDAWRAIGQHWIAEMLRLEEESNRLFIDAYGLQDELTPEVPIEQITLSVNPWYRYKPRKSKAEATEDDGPGIEAEILEEGDSSTLDWSGKPGDAGTAASPQIFFEGDRRMREDGARELVSYALGCLMGRYSLDEGGLVYAEAGGQGFGSARYRSYPADDDGIVPVTDCLWFETDAALRVEAFVRTVWGGERHEANMAWLAEGLGAKSSELPLDTLRRYLAGDFYKDHLQTYKKRPIYWKFSSGKEKAFEALVYLHRYHEGTLSRMRMQYVVPLTGQMRKKIDSLDAQVREAASTAERKRLEKEQATLQKKLAELARFDEELNHYAQSQIALDLDDGVRVNYGKFGGLLANVKDVCGKAED